jgi:hypothetical protein
MKTRSQHLIGLLAVAALVCASAIAAGCSQGKSAAPTAAPRAGGEAGRANSGANSFDGSDSRPFVDRKALDPKKFGHVTPAELGTRLGVDLKLPAKAAGGEFQGINESSGKDSFTAIYSNDVVIHMRGLRDPADAADLLTVNYLYPGVLPHVTKWDLNGTTAYAVPKLNVAPVLTGETKVLPGGETVQLKKTGTGIWTGTAEVFWQRGRFVVEVMNPDQSIEALKGIARSMTFEPRASSAPASSTPASSTP